MKLLYQYARQGNIKKIQELLAAGLVDPWFEEGNENAVYKAIANRKTDAARLLLDAMDDINVPDKSGNTALMYAARFGDVKIVEYLLGRGAKVNVSSSVGSTPLSNAAAEGFANIVEMLIKRGAKVDTPNMFGVTALQQAVIGNDVDVIKVLIKAGANPHIKNRHGEDAFDIAKTYNRKVAKLMGGTEE